MRLASGSPWWAAVPLVIALGATAGWGAPARVLVGGKQITGPPGPALRDGVVWGPLADCGRAIGAQVTWDQAARRLTIVTPAGVTVTVVAGERSFTRDGVPQALSAAATVFGGELFCPLARPLEALGCAVAFDKASGTLRADYRLVSLVVAADDRGVGVLARTTGPVEGMVGSLSDPDRVFVDLPHVTLWGEQPTTYVNLAGVLRVRVGQSKASPPTARIVLDLRSPLAARWEPLADGCGGRLSIGELQGDEPVIERRKPQLLEVGFEHNQPGREAIVCQLTDPLEPLIETQETPPAVILRLPEAVAGDGLVVAPVAGEFIRQVFVEQDPAGGARLRVALNQLIGFRTTTDADRSTVTLEIRRRPLSELTIVIDPGHGGRDSGARGLTAWEKDINLDVALRVAAGLRRAGARAILTRDQDVFADLYSRPEVANRLRADLLVSIHCNAFMRPDVGRGTETYWYTRDSQCLAMLVHRQLLIKLGRRDNGVRTARFVVIREAKMPACLVELMYLDNRQEEKLLQDPAVRQRAAVAIVEGLRQYAEGSASQPASQPAIQ